MHPTGKPTATESPPDWAAARRLIGPGRLSIVMPAYRLGHAIAANLEHVRTVFTGHLPFEIIPVDDGSDDNTRHEIERTAARYPEILPVYIPENAGKGAALRRGFEAARGNFVLLLDADLDLPPEQAADFFAVMEREQADVVIGSKMHPESRLSYPWHRRVMSRLYYGLVKCLIGLPVHDTQTGIKLFTREALGYAVQRMLVKRFAFDLELLAIIHNKGFAVAEAPVTLHFRAGFGCMHPRAVRQVMQDTLAIFYRTRILHYYRSLWELRLPEPPPLVSIVIPCTRPGPRLAECLDGVRRQRYGNYEVILLPDATTGRTWQTPLREIPTGPVRKVNKRNAGIRAARGTFIAFLDENGSPAEEWLERALGYFPHPDIAAVGGPLSAARHDSFAARIAARIATNPLVSGKYRYRYTPDRVRTVRDHPLGNLVVRTEVLQALGGLDGSVPYGDDVHLGLEIRKRWGGKIVYDPWAQVRRHVAPLWLPHLRRLARHAFRRGRFARLYPGTLRSSIHVLPALFVLAVAAGGVSAVFIPPLRPVYGYALAIYTLLVLLGSVPWESLLLRFRLHAATTLITALGIIATHAVYGIGFLAGGLTPRAPATRPSPAPAPRPSPAPPD
ncbi:MAG: glycosyltransferase [Lentisphaerae bacterium]|nr:glycosyltransferase [Lentisphaerota bacterium]